MLITHQLFMLYLPSVNDHMSHLQDVTTVKISLTY